MPSAGPYYVVSEEPDEGVVLRRNPNYEGPRPRRSAEIRISVPVAHDEAIARVEEGQADLAIEAVTPGSAGRLAARYDRPRYRIDRLLGTDYLLFNLRRPTFADLRLRRAVNFAIDRGALARAGGILDGLPARPTDQYLPPGMPGFQDAHVYPLQPDLEKARVLAGARRRVVRLYTLKDEWMEPLAGIVKANLKAIGMDVQITTINSFDRFAVPGEPWDVALVSWYADRPEPIDFLHQFDGRLVEAGAFPNLAHFADPDYDRRFDAANGLTGAERYIAFGRLDAHLARSGVPFAAFSNEARHTFLSARVGCQVHQPTVGINLAALCIRDEE
jgi:peptide/nickel transport system substrate-binding protein